MKTGFRVCMAVLMGAVAGCGGSTLPQTPARARPSTSAVGQVAERPETPMVITGITGSLSAVEVNRALQPQTADFGECFGAAGRIQQVGGRIELSFQVSPEGTVAHVRPIDSTLGHRAVEQCLLEVAQRTRFPRPHGGEAEVTWPLELDPAREPATWDAERVSRILERRGTDARQSCDTVRRQDRFLVTAYVSRRGRVVAAGAVANAPEGDTHLDCIVAAVRAWPMPRHRARLAKVTFEL